ncbi:MAG TPA: PorT family protein [Candidatus Marinimicrobia bacterium]|nr:PorT family protein [Candidatus Neomarinimicrobiota bacterium]
MMQGRQIAHSIFIKIIILWVLCGTTGQSKIAMVQKGALGGMTAARLWGAHVTKESWRMGGWLGVYILTPVADNLYFRPELSLCMRGYRLLYENPSDLQDDLSEAILELTYLDLPLLFQSSIPVDKDLNTDIFFGAYLSWNISATAANKFGDSKIEDEVNSIRKYDLGFIAGSQLQVSEHCYAQLRGCAGILPVSDTTNPSRKYNLWIAAGLQYRF